MLIKDIINKYDKSKIKAGEGNSTGVYPLYTCSPVVNKFLDEYLCDSEAIIMSTGGNFSIHYVNGKFNYSTDCFVFDTDKFNIKYLYYYLLSQEKNINKMFRGAGLKHLNKNEFNLINVKEKSLDEQLDIVNKLDLISALIENRKQEISKCDNLVKSQFVEMFGDININNKGWIQEKLLNHLKVVGGYAFKSSDFKKTGIPILRIGNINAGFFKPKDLMFWDEDLKLQNYLIYPNDLVMSLTGTVGKDDYGNVCIMSDDYDRYYLNQRNAKLALNDTIDKYYISYALKVYEIKKRLTGISRGVRQANISNRDIENLVIPIPPIELQNKFANIVEQIDKQKFVIMNSVQIIGKMSNLC